MRASNELLDAVESRLVESGRGIGHPDILARVLPVRPKVKEIEQRVAEELKDLDQAAPPEIPIVINAEVRRWIDYFQTRSRDRFSRYLARSGRYVPLMVPILRSYELPHDLIYVALVESGFYLQAYSRAHAVGPWQFIRGTAVRYGLTVNALIDERRDPIKSTHAAAKYLRELYAEFGSWYLAAAAYNAGEGKIRKALKIHGGETFWDIANPGRRKSFLRRETREYVPKMIAAAIIAKDPKRYGFGDVVYDPPMEFETVPVPFSIDLLKLAGELRVKPEALRDLNPELNFHITPALDSPYPLRVPKGASLTFTARLEDFKAAPLSTYITHSLRPNESVSSVARRYKISLKTLLAMNNISNPRSLKVGTRLKIPVKLTARTAWNADISAKSARRAGARTTSTSHQTAETSLLKHKVKRGESLYSIAKRYHVNREEILARNHLGNPGQLKAGQTLIIPAARQVATKTAAERPAKAKKTTPVAQAKPKSSSARQPNRPENRAKNATVVHVVKPGENIWSIAKKYQVNYRQVLAWNNIRDHRRIQIGERLTIHLGNGHSS